MNSIFAKLQKNIDDRIARELDVSRYALARFEVNASKLPHYRFVDLFRAADAYCRGRGNVTTVASEHDPDLNMLLSRMKNQWMGLEIKRPTNIAWPVGVDEEEFLPVDHFWLCGAAPALVVRLRYNEMGEVSVLEVATGDAGVAQEAVSRILKRSVEASVYRNEVIDLAFEPGRKDEYGDVEKRERLLIRFKRSEPVSDDDIVIDDDIREVLRRNVIDLHTRRELLKSHGVPVRRGVLLYGPPGTGKTFACRYLCGKLPETTRIVVAGSALTQVNAIFSLARLFQPSLLILEDVDLVFSSREITLYSTVLGDMLDQMDGLRPHEDIGIVLTTNEIGRMEAAIRDRPGRISQCIKFDPPRPELRGRYLRHYLAAYPMDGLDMERLVEQSDGATQAFLKEWVHRAVQFAVERVDEESQPIELKNADFDASIDEMKRYSPGTTGRIIGFHTG